ncbi:MAG: hypothetical protein ACPGVG_18160 [Mycobacterium sp.]
MGRLPNWWHADAGDALGAETTLHVDGYRFGSRRLVLHAPELGTEHDVVVARERPSGGWAFICDRASAAAAWCCLRNVGVVVAHHERTAAGRLFVRLEEPPEPQRRRRRR